MNYKPELGIFGNIQRLFEDRNKTNAQVFNAEETAKRADATATELKETEALTLETLLDQGIKISEIELGL